MAIRDADLEELLRVPRETLDVEVKAWLDLTSNKHRAALAKEMIALANHGGGHIVVGLTEDDEGSFHLDDNRPADLSAWSQDNIQSIVSKYLEPPVQCRVLHVKHPLSSLPHPIITIPGGHRAPIKSKSGSPDGKKLVAHRVYIRRPGPASEEPLSSADWDDLLERCLRNRQNELLSGIRDILTGTVPVATASATSSKSELTQFTEAGRKRWKELVAPLPANAAPRFPLGYYEAALSIQGPFDKLKPNEFRDLLQRALKNHSGWPPFVIIDRVPYSPRLVDGAIETWMGPEPDGSMGPPSHCDFWRIAPTGQFYTRRGYSEDDRYKGTVPGKNFNITTPIWRIGEVVLQAAYVAKALRSEKANLIAEFRWTGLKGRELISMDDPSALSIPRHCHQNAFETAQAMSVDAIPDALPEIIFEILEPLYQLFDFFQLPKRLVSSELRKLTAHSFG